MKKRFVIIAVLVGLLASCPEEVVDEGYDPYPDPQTGVAFTYNDDLRSCVAVVYNDARRRDEDKIAEVPAGAYSRKIELSPGEATFYFSYRIGITGIENFFVDYRPREMGNGKDQTITRIDANKITTVPIPRLRDTVSLSDGLLADKCYMVINNSSAPFRLQNGSSLITPDNFTDPLVNSGEQAHYTIAPGSASTYRLQVPPNEIPLSDISVFKAGYVYYFSYNGVSNIGASEIPIELGNVSNVSHRRDIAIKYYFDGVDRGGYEKTQLLNITRNGTDYFHPHEDKGEGYSFYAYPGEVVKVYGGMIGSYFRHTLEVYDRKYPDTVLVFFKSDNIETEQLLGSFTVSW